MADGANPDAALLLAAGQLREGWVEREGLDETTPLSEGELAVATRMLAALRAAGTVTADEVGLLDSTLLTQYVRGEFDDDVAKWDAQLLKKVEAGLLLRGRGIYDVDSGATMYPPGFTYADLLKARVDLDERTHAAYVTRLFGESENGHLLHCERVMDVNIDALVAIPLEKVLLVRLQMLETIRTLKVRKSESEGRRIFKHILILDLQGIPIRKLMFSSGARACIAAVLGVAEHFPETTHQIFLVNVPWLFHKAYETFVKPRLTTMTMSKIKVFGNDAPAINAAMRDAGIPQSAIPQYLNGDNPGRSLLDISKELIDASAAAGGAASAGAGGAAAK